MDLDWGPEGRGDGEGVLHPGLGGTRPMYEGLTRGEGERFTNHPSILSITIYWGSEIGTREDLG